MRRHLVSLLAIALVTSPQIVALAELTDAPGTATAQTTGPVDDTTIQEVGTGTIGVAVTTEDYPILSTDDPADTRTWRIVQGTGNCCETYLASTPGGRLLDFGGGAPRFSDDGGQTWQEVDAPYPYQGGEGAVTTAPNGDVLGVGWSPYRGDLLWAHKYDASEDSWYFSPIPVHQPFYDRPRLATIPGPFDTDEGTAPYVALLMGGYPFQRPMFSSTDGLTYREPSWEYTYLANSFDEPLDPGPFAGLDASQPHRSAEITPIGQGRALALGWGCVSNTILDSEMTWRCLDEPIPDALYRTDADGTMHRLRVVENGTNTTATYGLSGDGGSTWTGLNHTLENATVVSHEMKVQAAHDQAVLVLQVRPDAGDGDRFELVRIDTSTGSPAIDEILQVGAGDIPLGEDLGDAGGERFDFSSLTLLPDGDIAVSFADGDHHPPSIAIEQR